MRHLLSSVRPEAHSVGEVRFQLGTIAAALDSMQHLQTAEEHPAVQRPLKDGHLHNNNKNSSNYRKTQIAQGYQKTTCTQISF